MAKRAEWIAGGIGAAMVVAAAAVFGVTHYAALVHRDVRQQTDTSQTGLNFPPVDQMCKSAGVSPPDMADCVNEETSAAEFVGAWLQLNGFLTNGRVDTEQIQLAAGLDAADQGPDAALPSDPADPGQPDLASGDAAAGLAPQGPDGLPGGDATAPHASPAQIAMLCLGAASDDWLKMHDCIAHNDPSSTIDGN